MNSESITSSTSLTSTSLAVLSAKTNCRPRSTVVPLDDATIANMKAKRARDRARDEAERQRQAVESGEQTDWQQAMREWEDWEKAQK